MYILYIVTSLDIYLLVIQTLLLWLTFFCCGISDSVRGPTLLDLKDLVGEKLSEVSTIITLKSLGGLCGALITGVVLDFLQPSYSYIFISLTYLFKSIFTLLLPFSPCLLVMQILEFCYGFCHGGFHTVANPLLLRIWSGRNSSPILYTMHFMYGMGALCTPIIASPFLQSKKDMLDGLDGGNITLTPQIMAPETVWTIKTLYPIVFFIMLLPFPFYIPFYLQERKQDIYFLRDSAKGFSNQIQTDCESRKPTSLPAVSRSKEVLVVVFTSCFYFAVSGVLNSFRSFGAAFAVNSSLQLTRKQAANCLAVFYLTFALVRAVLIPISIFVSSTNIISFSILALMVSTSVLSAWGDSSVLCLQVGLALTGAGVASLFAAGILWTKSVIKFNNKIGGVICFSMRISEQVYSYVVGGLVDTQPVSFLYLMSGTVTALLLCFIIMNAVARILK